MMQRICFLYIDEPYNIYHSISIAIRLHKSINVKVQILCTERNYKFALAILKDNDVVDLQPEIIKPFWHYTLPHYIEIKLQHRYFLFRKYRKILSNYDGIVCSLYNDLLLRKFINKKPKLIFAGHGIANRNYSYDNQIKEFDYILLAGEKEKSIRKTLGQLDNQDYIISGYVKYDICKGRKVDNPFQNTKPIIFYNPHWLKEFSSYYAHGNNILEQFSQQDEYNLIFAPHSLLTTRNRFLIPEIMKYQKYDNIHIDLGSIACHDMTYLKLSHYYLGDISSQALEFLLHKKRPCIYIDVNSIVKSNYEFHTWELGDVITSSNVIIQEIKRSKLQHQKKYSSVQKEAIKKLFLQSEKSSTEIAANGIYNYISES